MMIEYDIRSKFEFFYYPFMITLYVQDLQKTKFDKHVTKLINFLELVSHKSLPEDSASLLSTIINNFG